MDERLEQEYGELLDSVSGIENNYANDFFKEDNSISLDDILDESNEEEPENYGMNEDEIKQIYVKEQPKKENDIFEIIDNSKDADEFFEKVADFYD